MFRYSIALAATLFAGVIAPAAGHAQAEDSQPELTTASYRDWTLRCGTVAETPPRRMCEVAQAVRAPDSATVLAQVVLGRAQSGEGYRLIVQLPPGVWLPVGASLALPEAEPAVATFTICQQTCLAETDLSEDFIAALRNATGPALLAFQDGARRQVNLPVSLAGFTAALGQLE